MKNESLKARNKASLSMPAAALMLDQGMRIPSCNAALDELLGGGLPLYAVSEWGVPLGMRGREFIVRMFLQPILQQMNQSLLLWIHDSDSALKIYPPAWRALGIDLSRLYYVRSKNSLRELKSVFLCDVFKFIVIDSPQKLRRQDICFLAQQARSLQFSVFLLRDHWLSNSIGNIWARARINCHNDPTKTNTFYIQSLRGGTRSNRLCLQFPTPTVHL